MTAPGRGSAASIHMDALRGLAALTVFVQHLRSLLLTDYENVTVHGPLVKGAYLLASMGHQAVMVFFVLSGYLISGSIFGALQQGRWSWRAYLANRLSRLWIVLIPGIVLTAACDRLGMSLAGTAGVYGGSPTFGHVVNFVVSQRAGVWPALGNALFLQTIAAPTFGSNSPLWSLANEFWYYVAFPLLVVPFLRRGQRLRTVLCVAGGLAVLAFTGISIALYFSVWLLGVLIQVLPTTERLRAWPFRATAVLLLCGTMVLPSLRVPLPAFATDGLIGLACAWLLYCNACGDGGQVAPLYGRVAQFMSRVSYSLYIYHLPFLVLVAANLVPASGRWQPDPRHLAGGVAVGASAVVYVIACWAVTEAHTDRLRRALRRRLGLAG